MSIEIDGKVREGDRMTWLVDPIAKLNKRKVVDVVRRLKMGDTVDHACGELIARSLAHVMRYE